MCAASQPWLERPFELLSWWTMEQFSAQAFYQIAKAIEKFRADHKSFRVGGDAAFAISGANKRLTPNEIAVLQLFATEVQAHCRGLGLKIAVKRI